MAEHKALFPPLWQVSREGHCTLSQPQSRVLVSVQSLDMDPPKYMRNSGCCLFSLTCLRWGGECCSSLASCCEAGMWWPSESHWCNSPDFVTWLTSCLLCITVVLACSYTPVSLSGLEEAWVARQVVFFPSSLQRVKIVSFCNMKAFNLWNLPLQQKYWQRHWMNFEFHYCYL